MNIITNIFYKKVKKMSSMLRQRVFNLLFLIISILTSAGIMNCHSKHDEKSALLNAIHPWRQDVEINSTYVAQIKAIQHIEIRAFEKGYLQTIYVDEGKTIHKGQRMFQIMPLLMQAEYAKALAEYEAVNIEYLNTQKLFEEKIVSVSEMNLLKARLNKSKAVLNLAKTHLDLTTIKAPFTGIMDRFRVRLGSLIEEGELLTTLSDVSKLWVYFNVSEFDYLNFKTRKQSNKPIQVKLMLANGEEYKHAGVIDTIEADFDNETGTIPFRATFPNPERLLRHGETGNVILKEEIKNALVVPQKATFEVLDKRYVFTVDAKGILKSTEVNILQDVPHLFVLQNGLSEEDVVLLEGHGKVRNGERVRIKLEDKETVLKGLELEAH